MRLIAHRGNVDGKKPQFENHPDYLKVALLQDYDVEIDIWYKNGRLYLGHDEPIFFTDLSFLKLYSDKLWIHCKNIEALNYLLQYKELNIFFHDTDKATLTSKGFIWTYPGEKLYNNSVCVLPETIKSDNSEIRIEHCYAICSDFILKYV